MHLAHLNIGRLTAPLDSPSQADFVAALDPINALADRAPGFVWRLQTDDGNATAIQAYVDPLIIVNLSVWESVDALSDYVYRSEHREIMARRREWFEKMSEAYIVLWWVSEGHIPTVEEATEKLTYLQEHGPTPHAFTFRTRFPAESSATT